MGKITWTTEKRKLSDLLPWDRNPRQLTESQAEHLEESLSKFGLVDPPAINTDNVIIGGHQRRNIMGLMKEYGNGAEIDVRVPSRTLTEREVEELNIRLNKNTGSFDFDALANNFEVDDLLDWGFEPFELGIEDMIDDTDAEPQIDRAEELREKWSVELGQLWQLGEHRLICGDCTDVAVVDRLMDGERAGMMFTDPPYGVAYRGNFIHSGEILEDGQRLWEEGIENDAVFPSQLFEDCFSLSPLRQGAACLVCAPAGRRLIDALKCWPDNWHYQSTLVWDKGALIISRWDYHPRHEFIFYGWVSGAAHSWYGGTKQSTVWEVQRQLGPGHVHPTQKPLEIPTRAVGNHTLKGDAIYDPFLGSGTTLIACENLGRKCRGVEIEPKYVAVTLQRYYDAFGIEPILIS